MNEQNPMTRQAAEELLSREVYSETFFAKLAYGNVHVKDAAEAEGYLEFSAELEEAEATEEAKRASFGSELREARSIVRGYLADNGRLVNTQNRQEDAFIMEKAASLAERPDLQQAIMALYETPAA